MHTVFTVLFLLVLIMPRYSFGLTVEFHPSKDNTIFQNSDQYLSNGSGPHFFSGNTADNGARRALIHFNIKEIPSDSIIKTAELFIYMDRTNTDESIFNLYKVNSDWGESSSMGARGGGLGGTAENGDATWFHRFFPDILWQNPGGDFEDSPSCIISIDKAGQYTLSSDTMLNDIKAWNKNPETNAGWILIGDETPNNITAKRFVSKDSNSADQRPVLKIIYDIPSAVVPNQWSNIKLKH